MHNFDYFALILVHQSCSADFREDDSKEMVALTHHKKAVRAVTFNLDGSGRCRDYTSDFIIILYAHRSADV